MVIAIDTAQRLLDHTEIPEKGILTSFGSFAPPGVTWLLLPGLAVFNDPRLFEYVGSLALYVGTLFGIFFLTRRYFGSTTALLAVAVYAFSELGLTAGSMLFLTYATRCFFVWMIYCVGRWVDHNDPKFLAGAILIWATGMYVFMEMAPAILVIPVVWLVYRPPVGVLHVALAAVLAIGLWSPYLRFEAQRNFIDVRSQVRRESIVPPNFSSAWCNQALLPQQWRSDIARREAVTTERLRAPTLERSRQWVSERANGVVENLLTNFRGSVVPGAAIVMFALSLIGLAICFLADTHDASATRLRPIWSRRIALLAGGCVILSCVVNEFVLARFVSADGRLASSSIKMIRLTELSLFGLALLSFIYRGVIATAAAAVQQRPAGPGPHKRVLGFGLGIPWVVLFLLADYDRRFWWIWPLHAVLLAIAVGYLPMRLGLFRGARLVASVAVLLMVAANPLLTTRVSDWMRRGWSGKDSDQVEVTDLAATVVRAAKHSAESIGYEIDVRRYVAIDHIIDPRYKVGADFDMLLKYRHRVSNVDQCAEGVHENDTYRIVQVAIDDPGRTDRIESRTNESFELMQRVGAYGYFGVIDRSGLANSAAQLSSHDAQLGAIQSSKIVAAQ